MMSIAMKMFHRSVHYGTQIVKIGDLQLTHAEYCNMNKLVNFGLAYKNDKMKAGEYGVPKRRIWAFMNGKWEVAQYLLRDCTNNTNEMSETRIRADQVPSFKDLFERYGYTMSEYVRNEKFENATELV